MVRLHCLTHVDHEGPGIIADWAQRRQWPLHHYPLHRDAELPTLNPGDWLVIMGGPMSVHDEQEHPWLLPERALIAEAIDRGLTVVGICLGAQQIARALGATVTPGPREIGWHPLHRQPAAVNTALAPALPDTLDAFHWHGETFALPAGATPLYQSEACPQQGFIVGKRTLALQFHGEVTPADAEAFISNSPQDLEPAPFVQPAAAMLADPTRFERLNHWFLQLLDTLADSGTGTPA